MSPLPLDDPSPLPPAFSAEAIEVVLGDTIVFSALSCTLGPGLHLVRGGEGRGKTTLLRVMAGLIEPRAGRVRRPAGPVSFETPADPAHDALVARAWLAAQRERCAPWREDRARALIDGFGLAEHIDKPLYMLSTGSRRKVGLVAAAASEAPLTLLDGPYAALDGPSSRLLTELLAEAATRRERTWVVADYERPAGWGGMTLAGVVDLGD